MDSMGLIPMGIIAIPAIPFGAAISFILQLLEYLINFFFELIAKIIQKMVEMYAKQLRKAKTQRAAALKKLYIDEKEAQDKMKIQLKEYEERIPEIYIEMDELKVYQAAELAKYKDTVFKYSEKAKAAEEEGNEEMSQTWQDMITSLDEWLVAILLITIEIMNKKLEVWEMERAVKRITPLTLIQLKKDWEFLEDYADDFEVPVPYYPDLPDPPSLPTLPVLPKGNCITDKVRQMLGKWITCPMILPIGLAIGGMLECVRAQMPTLPPPAAAKMESITDGIVKSLGIVI